MTSAMHSILLYGQRGIKWMSKVWESISGVTWDTWTETWGS